MKHKEMSVETLRGIAIILMVAGHVIGHNDAAGMKVGDNSVLRYFYYTLQYLRMPLFTVISGYVYSMRPFLADSGITKFLGGKARRLLIPLISVSTIQYTLRALVPGINNPVDIINIWEIYIFGFDQFWFLQSIFLVFATIVIIENFKLLDTFQGWLVVLTVTMIVRIFIPPLNMNIFSINGYFQLLPFFLLGCGLKKYSTQLFNQSLIYINTVIFVVCFVLLQIQWFHPFLEKNTFLKIIILLAGFSGIILLFRYRFNQPFLSRLGYYAFSIYLFHVLGTVTSRLLLELILPEAYPAFIFGFSLFFGLMIPVFMEKRLVKYELTKNVFIGTFSGKKTRDRNVSKKAA